MKLLTLISNFFKKPDPEKRFMAMIMRRSIIMNSLGTIKKAY